MAVKSKEEILKLVSDRVGDDTSDEALSFIEDVSDTIVSLEAQVTESGDWKSKYYENDKAWRERYRERFMSDDPVPQPKDPEPDPPAPKYKTFADLFTEE